MQQLNGLILSQDVDTVSIISQICRALNVNLERSQDMKTFLLKAMQNGLKFIIFDCGSSEADAMGWVKLIRHMRPKVPLVVVCDNVNRDVGGRMLEEGIFYLAIRPFQQSMFTQVLKAALNQEK